MLGFFYHLKYEFKYFQFMILREKSKLKRSTKNIHIQRTLTPSNVNYENKKQKQTLAQSVHHGSWEGRWGSSLSGDRWPSALLRAPPQAWPCRPCQLAL